MATMDVFNNNEFGLTSLTGRVNEIPYVPTRIEQLGLFEKSGIVTNVGFIDAKAGVVSLIGSSARGTEPAEVAADSRNAIPVQAVRLAEKAKVMADDVLNLRAFGSESEAETVMGMLDQKLATATRNLDATLEWHKLGALKGQVLDADALTVILDLFTAFGITKPATVSFPFSTATQGDGEIRKACSTVVRGIEDALGMAIYDHIHAFVGANFMDELADNPETREAFVRQADGAGAAGRVARRQFNYGGIVFEEYRGKVGSVQFVGDDDAHFFPVGTPGLFQQVYGPADRVETVGTLGLPRYALPFMDPKGRFMETEVQSNPISYCTRPGVLVPGTAA